MKPVTCGPYGNGFTVRDGNDFATKFTSVMQFPLRMVCITAGLAINLAASGGTFAILDGFSEFTENDRNKHLGLKTDDLKIYEVAQNFKPYLEQEEAKDARALVEDYANNSNMPCQTETIIQKTYKDFIEYMDSEHPLWKEQHGLYKNVDDDGVVSWCCSEHSQFVEQPNIESEKKKNFRRASVDKILKLTNSISEGATTMLTVARIVGDSKMANVENGAAI